MKRLSFIFAFLPLALTLIWLQFLPDQVPMHYDFSGNIDRWGSKWENLLLPGIVLAMGLIFLLVSRFGGKTARDEKQRAQAETNRKVLRIVLLATSLIFTVLQAVLLWGAGQAAAKGAARIELPLNRVTVLCLCLMMIVLGNFMPRARMNHFLGFRCDWTMFNDVTWQKGNRFAGIVMICSSLVTALLVLVLPDAWAVPVFLVLLTGGVILSLLYARRVYREEQSKA